MQWVVSRLVAENSLWVITCAPIGHRYRVGCNGGCEKGMYRKLSRASNFKHSASFSFIALPVCPVSKTCFVHGSSVGDMVMC